MPDFNPKEVFKDTNTTSSKAINDAYDAWFTRFGGKISLESDREKRKDLLKRIPAVERERDRLLSLANSPPKPTGSGPSPPTTPPAQTQASRAPTTRPRNAPKPRQRPPSQAPSPPVSRPAQAPPPAPPSQSQPQFTPVRQSPQPSRAAPPGVRPGTMAPQPPVSQQPQARPFRLWPTKSQQTVQSPGLRSRLVSGLVIVFVSVFVLLALIGLTAEIWSAGARFIEYLLKPVPVVANSPGYQFPSTQARGTNTPSAPPLPTAIRRTPSPTPFPTRPHRTPSPTTPTPTVTPAPNFPYTRTSKPAEPGFLTAKPYPWARCYIFQGEEKITDFNAPHPNPVALPQGEYKAYFRFASGEILVQDFSVIAGETSSIVVEDD